MAEGGHEGGQNLLVYPTEVVVDDVNKTVNMAWFAQQYLLTDQAIPTNADYQLATYAFAKAFPMLPRDRWRLMFTEQALSTDEHLMAFLSKARDFYRENENPRRQQRAWSNTVLGYLRRLLYLPAKMGVSQLLFLKLAGHLQPAMELNEIQELMGGIGNLIRMDFLFNGVKEAQYQLVLPDNIQADYLALEN